jgi:hypothetical protein
MATASFTVSDGVMQAAVTITRLGGAQDLLSNINRWRGQVGLAPISSLDEAPPVPIELAGASGQLVDVAGPAGHTLAVMATDGGGTWFVKMTGPDALVAGARTDFDAFVRSLRTDGAADG